MTTISNVIKLDKSNTQGAAVLLEDGLYDKNLVANFSPTHSSIVVLEKLSQAVLPGASKDQRAMNWYGSYGSGKSHLGTLIGQLLRDGAHTSSFDEFLRKLENFGEAHLVNTLKKSFLSPSDPDSKPYLIVPLYASQTPSIPAKLMEGLYKAIDRQVKSGAQFNAKDVLPKTEYDAAKERFSEIVSSNPEYVDIELSKWSLDENYYNTDELYVGLDRHEPTALVDFCTWHEKVCHGAIFQPQNTGGKGFVEAYKEAAKNLINYGYGGIVVLWDEFGNALEDLIRTPYRNPIDEIIQLQEFVEHVCQPSSGHIIFIGMTHVSMAEYGARSDSGQDVQDRLKTIEGRFTPIRIELKASETEGYHLLGVQTAWSKYGNELFGKSQNTLNERISVWKTLPLFHLLAPELVFIAKSCYPLHPITAAALFAISTRYAQATRTAFTFLRDMDQQIWEREINGSMLFGGELVRLPILVKYYEESLGNSAISELEKYQKAVAEVHASANSESKVDILKIIFLSVLLGENFQATDSFLSISLYDCPSDEASQLFEELAWLQKAGLVWKNDMTGLWTLAGDAGVDADPLIEETLRSIPVDSVENMLRTYPVLKDDLLPMLGEHKLEPSNAGIIRSYSVEMRTAPFEPGRVLVGNQLSSAKVVMVFCRDADMADRIKIECRRTPSKDGLPIYYWISELNSDVLLKGLRKYLAIFDLLKQKTHGEGLRRQLQAKWERNRHELFLLVNERFGRQGLETGKTKVILGGKENPIPCRSWHEFKNILTHYISTLYPSEVEVRSARINDTTDDFYNGRKIISDIVDRILEFDNNNSYHNDLLGYGAKKQEAAIIDGLLGKYSNDLFIKREKKWDIKTVEEVTGSMQDVLKLIRSELLRKRDNPYKISELKSRLVGVPYGLPPSVHSLFTAIALRQDMHRIEVVGSNQISFRKQLGKAFIANTTLKIRVQDFNKKQKMILEILYSVLHNSSVSGSLKDEELKGAVSELKKKIADYPDNIKHSSQLTFEAHELVLVLNAIGKTTHDIANKLIKLTPFKMEWAERDSNRLFTGTVDAINNILAEFDKLANERIYALKEVMRELVPEDPTERAKLVKDLESYNAKESKQVATLLGAGSGMSDAALKYTVKLFTGKSYDECTDIEIGQLTGKLRSLFEHVKVPLIVLEPPPEPNYTKIEDLKNGIQKLPGIAEEDSAELVRNMVVNLSKVIEKYTYNYKYDSEIVSSAVTKLYEKYNSK